MKKRIDIATQKQFQRLNTDKTNANLNQKEIETYCTLSQTQHQLLEKAIHHGKLSARSIMKVLKLSRTIADLDGQDPILDQHILEALSYKQSL